PSWPKRFKKLCMIPDPPTNQKPTILLADDDAPFREAHARLLQRHGFECLCAPDAPSALQLLQEREIDALIADIHMPGNIGLELIQSLPQVSRGLPVILLTGLPSVETAARSVRLAVAAYLVKPPDLDELLTLLRQLIPQYRRLRVLRDSRQHLQQWADELALLESNLQQPPMAGETSPRLTGDYLRVTLRHLMLELAALDRSLAACGPFEPTATDLRQLDLVQALRHTIGVIQKTRQNFHSKELAELRRQLQALLPPESP
ncbi:MAG TPA: response regulator, partial [Clostridia bacterium]|nr:response regulator [Clostridia bacterium]